MLPSGARRTSDARPDARRAALSNLAHHRIDQERHIVIDDLDDRDRLAICPKPQSGTVSQRIFGVPGLALGHEIVGALGQRRDIVGAVTHHVLRHGPAVKLRDECCRDLAPPPAERRARLLDQRGRARSPRWREGQWPWNLVRLAENWSRRIGRFHILCRPPSRATHHLVTRWRQACKTLHAQPLTL